MEILKEKKAITLVVLVITIVVLIILAGVIISITLGNGGIIDKAKLAKQEYANAQGKEEKEIAEYSNKIDEYASLTRAGGSSYKIEKIGDSTETTPIPYDATKYDEVYIEVTLGVTNFVFNIKTITLSSTYKYYISSAYYNGSGYWCGINISNENIKNDQVRRDNVDKTSDSSISAYGIKY